MAPGSGCLTGLLGHLRVGGSSLRSTTRIPLTRGTLHCLHLVTDAKTYGSPHKFCKGQGF